MNYVPKRIMLHKAELCAIFRRDEQTLRRWTKNKKSGWPGFYHMGQLCGFTDEIEVYLQEVRAGHHQQAFTAVRGVGGTHRLPDAIVKADAAQDLRFILVTGEAPERSLHWRNGRLAHGSPDRALCAMLDLPPSTSWAIAFEHAERLISLKQPAKALALKGVADRLASFHGEAADLDEALS